MLGVHADLQGGAVQGVCVCVYAEIAHRLVR